MTNKQMMSDGYEKNNSFLFLFISFFILVISIVTILPDAINDIKEAYQIALKNDVYKNMGEFWIWCILGNIFTKAPIILSEISLIKNLYNLFAKKTFKIQKTFYLVSLVFTIVMYMKTPKFLLR